MNILKKIALITVALGCTFQVQAFEKKQMVLANVFWGTWSIYNAQNKCTETYQFKKPGQFQYTSKLKSMSGNFSVMRNTDLKTLDILTMKVNTDNKKASCAQASKDFTGQTLSLGLKWVSQNTAQICSDTEGKQCSSLYLIKQK
ncbi:hypothetical protein ACG94X_16565 [Acinetobacter sp. ULE_I010]|uniref:hypothetical protein n=1 Tax=Acinetobacter sp. ULE_I010 TaxID=3373065 RepID=UPI003AF9AE82